MEDMLSRNSFPQICVVSVTQSLRIVLIRQEYEGSGPAHVKSCQLAPPTAPPQKPLIACPFKARLVALNTAALVAFGKFVRDRKIEWGH